MSISYKKKAVKYISTCDRQTKRRLKDAIEALPLGDVTKLSGYACEYRLRVGDLRVLFTMDDEGIVINEIGPRGQIYKKR